MKYIILRKSRVTDTMLKSLGGGNYEPIAINVTEVVGDVAAVQSAFCFLTTENDYPDYFNSFRKMNKAEFDVEVLKIKDGDHPDHVMKESISNEALSDPAGFRFRGQRIIAQKINTVDLTDGKIEIDFVIPNDRYIDGAQFRVVDHDPLDYISFDIVSADGLTVIESFVTSWGVSDTFTDLRIYKAYLFAGLILRCTYHKVGVAESTLIVNAYLHRFGKGA